MDPERSPDPTSPIAQERVQPGPPSVSFWIALSLVGGALFLVLVGAGLHPTSPTESEAAAGAAPLGLADRLGLEGARIVSAASIAATAVCTALAGRRLLHSDGAGILAGVLLALDPGTLGLGRLALPDAIALASLTGAFAAFLTLRDGLHWLGAGLLALAALAQPASILWGIPLGAMGLLRGHIYAAPRHLGISLAQGLLVPGIAAGTMVALGTTLPACIPMLSALSLAMVPLHGPVALVHNPILWLGGLAALAVMAGAALLGMGRQVRIARLPGRLQLRLPDALHPMASRVLWLLALALLAPLPAVWMVLAALALAAGVVWLSEDAPGFGLAVALVLVGFGVVGLVRGWPLITGAGDPSTLTTLVPWGRAVSCP
ncbi:MAG: hypothetical protein AABX89_06655 [Candidatus Thermoplasmatota archaeon]